MSCSRENPATSAFQKPSEPPGRVARASISRMAVAPVYTVAQFVALDVQSTAAAKLDLEDSTDLVLLCTPGDVDRRSAHGSDVGWIEESCRVGTD